jgi:hypothetical protein
MTTYKITSSAGMDMGTWEAESPEAAMAAMHADAGYPAGYSDDSAPATRWDYRAGRTVIDGCAVDAVEASE